MSDRDERWLPVVGYEGIYEISNLGEVRRIGGPHLRGSRCRGYNKIFLYKAGVHRAQSRHRMVMAAFVGPANSKVQVDHINGDKRDCRLANLRYCTSAENSRFAAQAGLLAGGEANGGAKLTRDQVRRIRAAKASGLRFWGGAALAAEFGVSRGTVRRVAVGELWVSPSTDLQP